MCKQRKLLILGVLVILFSLGCSRLPSLNPIDSGEGLTPARLAVLSTTEKYLTAIVQGNEPVLDRVVLWGEYNSDLGDIDRSRGVIFHKIRGLKPQWTKEQTPFKNFKVEDVNINGNLAEVELSRGSEDLEVELQWSGRSWLVVGDNIFGRYGFLTKM